MYIVHIACGERNTHAGKLLPREMQMHPVRRPTCLALPMPILMVEGRGRWKSVWEAVIMAMGEKYAPPVEPKLITGDNHESKITKR